ncbi:MAG: class I SAM-dependent methyltransferase [Nitrospiraceae bacterium]|nr:class I SAM-dependent methyltransferase [Nitrospiraceae bacterium]
MKPGTIMGMTEAASPARGMETIPCDLCHSKRSELVLQQRDLLLGVTDEEFRIVRCCECGLVYLNPRPSRDLIGTYYPTAYYPPVATRARPPFQQQAKRLSAKMKRWVLEEYYGYPSFEQAVFIQFLKRVLLWPDKVLREFKGRHPLPWRGEGKVLDVGCGTGGNLKALQDQGWHVSGIEISEIAAAHAQALTGGQIHTGTLETHPFAPQTFDLILMSHSLEHLPSPADALHRVYTLLNDNGLLVVSVPNVRSLEAMLFGRDWFHWDPPRHFYHFGRSTLTQLLAQAGFLVHQFRTGVGAPFFMASVDRWWNQRFGTNVPMRKLIDRLLARPLCLIAGHAGYGTEITVYAEKVR